MISALDGEKLLTVKEVSTIVGLSRPAIYAAMSEGRFPRKLGLKSVRWRVSDIDAWIQALPTSKGDIGGGR